VPEQGTDIGNVFHGITFPGGMRGPAIGRVRRSLLRSNDFVSSFGVTAGTRLLGAASSRGPRGAIRAAIGVQTRSEEPDCGRPNLLRKKSIFHRALQALAKLSPTRGSKIRRFGITTPATTHLQRHPHYPQRE
jgi:hypothetical protein